MAWEDANVFVTSGARTTSGNSGAIGSPRAFNLGVTVEVTAQSGTTPTLDFSIEWSMDGTNFCVAQPADSYTQITTTTGRTVKTFVTKAPFFRLVWTIGGTTPSYTFLAWKYGAGQ